MRRIGGAKLWLVEGGVPHFREMVLLGGEIARVIIEERGEEGFIELLSDANWLSCLACTLGFEWDTSGQTTVTIAALKEALARSDLGVRIVGGKGLRARDVESKLRPLSQYLELGDNRVDEIIRDSTLSCKIDSAALQDSYSIYFHALVVAKGGSHCVVNQGMNVYDKTARRYHWGVGPSRVEEPHSGMLSDASMPLVLDLTSKDSRECRKACVDLVVDKSPESLQRDFNTVRNLLSGQYTLESFIDSELKASKLPSYLLPPKKLNLDVFKKAKESVSNFEELLLCRDIGPAAIRGLAYVASIIYGSKVSWRDPVRYAYAHGTKSGRPYYVNRQIMRKEAEFLKEAVEEARIGRREKLEVLRRLSSFLEND